MDGFFGNVAEQAAYRGWRADSDGDPIDGGKHNYRVTFSADDQAQVRFFWSVTMNPLPEPFFYANPEKKYAITGRASELARNSDGSVTPLLTAPNSERRAAAQLAPGTSWSVSGWAAALRAKREGPG